MDLVPITPTLWMLRFPVVNAYLARMHDGLALVDCGTTGCEGEVLDAVGAVGAALRQIVLTHCHKDHVGAAAELRSATGAEVVAGVVDAAVIAGRAPEPEFVVTDQERPYYERVSVGIPAAPPCTVDRVVREGDDLGWAEPAVVLDTPGHTPGGIAIHLPAPNVLITGDTIASLDGHPILGPFNVDRATAIASFRRMAELDPAIACFGHGDPLVADTGERLRRAAARAT